VKEFDPPFPDDGPLLLLLLHGDVDDGGESSPGE
jgi:hypothetical protein